MPRYVHNSRQCCSFRHAVDTVAGDETEVTADNRAATPPRRRTKPQNRSHPAETWRSRNYNSRSHYVTSHGTSNSHAANQSPLPKEKCAHTPLIPTPVWKQNPSIRRVKRMAARQRDNARHTTNGDEVILFAGPVTTTYVRREPVEYNQRPAPSVTVAEPVSHTAQECIKENAAQLLLFVC